MTYKSWSWIKGSIQSTVSRGADYEFRRWSVATGKEEIRKKGAIVEVRADKEVVFDPYWMIGLLTCAGFT